MAAWGQPAAPVAGGFGAPAAPVAGGFGAPAAAPVAGGFGAPAAPAPGGFGAPAAPAAPGAFGAPAAAPGAFGAPAAPAAPGGFGAPAAPGGFGAPAAPAPGYAPAAAPGAFGAPAVAAAPVAGGFGAPAAPGGFGAPAVAPAAGGFGAPAAPAAGGFGAPAAPAAGGFGAPAAAPAVGGFGAPAAAPAPGGFGAPAAPAGGFGAKAPAPGGFGAPAAPAVGGFGAPAAPAAGGFGAKAPAPGGFGAPAAPAAGGFGAKAPAPGGFGAPAAPAAGGFGAPAAPVAGGFGAPAAPAAGGFGAPAAPAAGGFGAKAPAPGGFGAPAAPAVGGFGAPAAPVAGGFGAPAGGFGAPAPAGFGAAAGAVPVKAPLPAMPDFSDKPYGNMLLYLPQEEAEKGTTAAVPRALDTAVDNKTLVESGPPRLKATFRSDVVTPAPKLGAARPSEAASAALFSQKAVSAASLRQAAVHDVSFGTPSMFTPARNLLEQTAADSSFRASAAIEPTPARQLPSRQLPPRPSSAGPAAAEVLLPVLRTTEYTTQPPIEALARLTPAELAAVRDFRVERTDGKCRVHFLAPVNLLRCVIDDAVELSADGRVRLYPKGDRPPLGTGLNVLARVKVWGVKGVSGDDLYLATRRAGNAFEEYSADEELWVYRVNDRSESDSDYEEDDDGTVSASDSSDSASTPGASPVGPLAAPTPGAWGSESWTPVNESRALAAPSAASGLALHAPSVHHPAMVSRDRGEAWSPSSQAVEVPFAVPQPRAVPSRRLEAVAIPRSDAGDLKPSRSTCVVGKFKSLSSSTALSLDAAAAQERPEVALGRSFRVGWAPGGVVAMPAHSELNDLTPDAAPEVLGSSVHLQRVVPAAPKPDAFAKVLQSLLAVTKTTGTGPATCDLSSEPERLSDRKMDALRAAATGYDEACLTKAPESPSDSVSEDFAWCLSARQLRSAVELCAALWEMPEGDQPFSNAEDEATYRASLRRQRLLQWLEGAVREAGVSSEQSPAQEVLKALITRDDDEALAVCREHKLDGLARVICISGRGNRVGPQIAGLQSRVGTDLARVVQLLAGEVHEFVAQPSYRLLGQGDLVRNPEGATWLQLLGIFAFYSCPETATAEDIVAAFVARLQAADIEQSRSLERALPVYSRPIGTGALAESKRARDYVARGNRFDDALYLVLGAIASPAGSTRHLVVPPQALHPHASSYYGTDYTTAFVLTLLLRSVGVSVPAGQAGLDYADAEYRAVTGFAAQLEAMGLWYWAVWAALFIVDPAARAHTVECLLERHSREVCSPDAANLLDRIGFPASARRSRFAAAVPQRPEAVPNAPSLASVAELHRALKAFASGGL